MTKKQSPARKLVPAQAVAPVAPADLLADVRTLIEQAAM